MNIKRFAIIGSLATMFSLQAIAEPDSPNIDMLTGDARTACEVILCLSSAKGKGIAECQAPLRKYFSIRAKKWHKTLAKRRAFLDLCPAANENKKMAALTTAIQNQEYACDAETLNSRIETKRKFLRRKIRTQSYIPDFCKTLYAHEFTEYSQIKKPKYICNPNKWYSVSDWERGYEKVIVSKKWNSYTDEYEYTYKDVPINKKCWE